MGETSAVNGTSGVYSNKIPWRRSKFHLPNTELCVPNAVNSGISVYSGKTDAHCFGFANFHRRLALSTHKMAEQFRKYLWP